MNLELSAEAEEMALGILVTYFLSSCTLLLFLLLLPPSECSQLIGDAASHDNANGRNANAIGTTLAIRGCVTILVFWILFVYFYLKSLNNRKSSTAAFCSFDYFHNEYGIMSRRRIRTQKQRGQAERTLCGDGTVNSRASPVP